MPTSTHDVFLVQI